MLSRELAAADALRRRWRSEGHCPPELLISDPYGQIAYVATGTRNGEAIATPQVCSWRLRPGFFVQDDLMSDGTGPITVTFTAMSLSPYEVVEIWSADTDEVAFKHEVDVVSRVAR